MENNSNSEMRNLVAYWILFYLISLFELVFLKLIYWLPFWPYMKVVAIFWLVLPHFSGAAYVYDCLLRPCLSVNPRVFIEHFVKPTKDLSLSTKSFLSMAEKYVKENGSESLEKLIDRKLNDTKPNIDVEEIKAVTNTEEKETATTIHVLHAGKTNKNALKTLIAAEYSGVQVGMAPDFEMGVSNKTPEFMKMNPIGKVPVLETPDGPVFESNAIARYVTCLKCDNPLYGSSLIETALIDQWIDFASLEIDANVLNWSIPRMGGAVYLPPAEEAAISALKRALGALNTYLASNTYLVGHAVTLADIIMTVNLCLGFTHVMTTSFTSEFPHVERYFWTMVNQPNFSKILGEVKQTEKVPPIASTKKPSQQKETAKSKTKNKPKKKAKKKPAKPKEEAVEKEEAAPKPKPKNSFDLLPPSKMILDEWKRLYSNTKTNFREVAIKGFWDMYDPEGYSLWFCDYKYNEENTVSLVTLNKVGGFLQRMDLVRKYAFGKMLVIGSEPPFKVKGVWLFRGQEIPQFVIDKCYDMELYDWKKAELTDEDQKERVNQMIEDEEAFEGEPLLDAKCFK